MTLDQRDRTVTGRAEGLPDGDGQDGFVPESAHRRFGRWVRYAPAERLPLVAAPVVWTAAEILNATHVPVMLPGMATLAAAGLAYGVGERRSRDGEHRRLRGAEWAGITGITGAWTTAATAYGPLAGPDHLLSVVYGLGAAGGYWWLRHHEAVRDARARRDAAAAAAAKALADRVEWHRLAALTGLQGSHLLETETNNNGDVWTVDLYSTRKLARQIDCEQLGQRLAGERGKQINRVEVTADGEWPYRLHVFFRKSDPWKGGSADAFIWHPSVSGTWNPDLPFAALVPPQPSIMDPISIGADPETGKPLQIPLFAADGAQRILICATSGDGKSNLLDVIRERVTACRDARLIQINLSKGGEDEWWQPLTEVTVLADDPDPAGRALAVLDFIDGAIKIRRNNPARKAGARWHRPTPDEPAFVVVMDEYNVLAEDPVRRVAAENIVSKCRSEGFPVIIATQRPAGKWVSTSIKANISYIVWAKMRTSDLRHHSGNEGFTLPDIGRYGGANKGIFGVATHPTHAGMKTGRGRAFFWGDDCPGMQRMIKDRTGTWQPYALEPALAPLAEQWDAISRGGVPDDSRYDIATTKTGTAVPGVANARARFAAVGDILDGKVPSPPPAPSGADENLPAGDHGNLSPDARQALAVYQAGPARVSVRQLADRFGWGKTKAHEVVTELKDAGLVRLQGDGRAAGFEARPDGPAVAAEYPPLRLVVPDDGSQGPDGSVR